MEQGLHRLKLEKENIAKIDEYEELKDIGDGDSSPTSSIGKQFQYTDSKALDFMNMKKVSSS